jgi:single-strand DNA-binding protein
MPGVNYCLMMGNLTADPELRFTSSGKAVTSFNLAISRFSKNEDKSTTFVKIVTWEKQAENCAKFLKKGSLASVEGRLQIRPYTDKNGETRRSTEIIATNVQFLNTRGEGSGSYGGNNFTSQKSGGSQHSGNGSSNDYMSSEDIPFDDISMDDIPF